MSKKSWDADISYLLQDTNKNISSIRGKLGNDKKLQHASFSSHRDSYKKSLPSSIELGKNRLLENSPRSSGLLKHSDSSLLMSLYKRFEEQSKTLQYLSDTVQSVLLDISTMKEVQSNLETKLRNGSSSIGMERRLDSMQRELRNEVDSIRTSLNNNNYSNKHHDTSELSRDIKSQRRFIEEETNSIRREVDNLKDRILKIESDFHKSTNDNNEFQRKFNNIRRDVSSVTDTQKQLRRSTDRREEELHYLKNQLNEISFMVTDLNHDASAISKNDSNKHRKHSYISNDLIKNTEKRSKKKLSEKPVIDSPISSLLLSGSSDLELSVESLTLDEESSTLPLANNTFLQRANKKPSKKITDDLGADIDDLHLSDDDLDSYHTFSNTRSIDHQLKSDILGAKRNDRNAYNEKQVPTHDLSDLDLLGNDRSMNDNSLFCADRNMSDNIFHSGSKNTLSDANLRNRAKFDLGLFDNDEDDTILSGNYHYNHDDDDDILTDELFTSPLNSRVK